MNKKPVALVTGGAGFIGSHMADLLIDNDFEVRVIDNLTGGREKNIKHLSSNKDFKFDKIDICKLTPENKIFSDVKYVFHFAAQAGVRYSKIDPYKYTSTNVMGTMNILETLRN